jgi:hypothetical protein
MKSFSILSAVTGLVALASAAPAPAALAPAEKRADVSVKLCTGRNYTGYCVDQYSASGECGESLHF